MFDSKRLFEIGLDPSTLYPEILPRPPPLPITNVKLQKRPVNELPIRADKLFKLQKKSAAVKEAVAVQRSEPFLGTEEEDELRDAMMPIYDQLEIAKGWWFLELVPLKLRYQRRDDEWVSEWA